MPISRVLLFLVPVVVAMPVPAFGQSPAAPPAPAPAAPAHLEIKTSDAKGSIFVDGQPAGQEGSFVGDVSAGAHVVEVRRDGFDTFHRQLSLVAGQTYAETVTLVRPADVVAESASSIDRPVQGAYGGFGFVGVADLGGLGSDLETGCGTLGAASCSTPSPLGGGVFGFAGYTWDPVGFELMLGGLVDVATQTATFNGSLANGQNPLLAGPARDEKFTILRVGPIGAVRARATFQNRYLRGTFAAGIGLAYKQMFLERKSTSANGALSDDYTPDSVSYLSPAISVDAAIQLRVSPTTALALGVMLWAESAGSSAATAPDANRFLAGGGALSPIATPQYHLATGAQTFLGPYLGMMFGP